MSNGQDVLLTGGRLGTMLFWGASLHTLRIARYKMYLKCLTGGHNVRKKFKKIKYVNMNMFHF